METCFTSSDHIAVRKEAGEWAGERGPSGCVEGEEFRDTGAETLFCCSDR